jgi:HEPN domain-containing protein
MTAKIDKQAEKLLRKAADDEVMARFPEAPDGPFGFQVQQTIEKLLKALLSQLGVEYPLTHDLAFLASRVESTGEILPPVPVAFSKIQSFAVVHRYDDVPEYTALDRPQALETIRILREHVVTRIASLSGAP